MKTIKKTIDIHASGEQVWKVLIEDQYNRKWFAEFGEGSHAVGDWNQEFIDNLTNTWDKALEKVKKLSESLEN